MAEPTLKSQAWVLFDQVVAEARFRDVNPWTSVGDRGEYHPDYDTLARLLGIPIPLGALSQSGVPALALDSRGQSGGTASASANLLGKNYAKQVDVVMSAWETGPELMISTKRMDPFGKNAANRVEEPYGEAKNLSLRHPQAALGFLYGLRSTAFTEESDTAAWLLDLLAKLGREADAYDAVGLVVPDWTAPVPAGDDGGAAEDAAPIAIEPAVFDEADPAPVPVVRISLESIPPVSLRHDLIPDELSPARFFAIMVDTVLGNSPINMDTEARAR